MNILAYINGIPTENPVITFYALFIVGGAIVALLLSNYRAKQDGYEFSFFNTIFLVAFPCGIIGARIWYVVAQWSSEFANAPWYHVFEIWQGGLAIQGGAIAGVLAGVLYVFFRRKGTPVLKCTDFAVPTILVAQAIGRWGNFFNQEVFGQEVSLMGWSFLPSFITNNMQNGTSGMIGAHNVIVGEGNIVAPLFLIEGIINIAFFFLITTGLESLEGKHYKNGDSTFFYFIAYGITRFVLEPMRNQHFIMGSSEDKQASVSMAIAFISIGLILFVLNHLIRYLDDKKKLEKVPVLGSMSRYFKERTDSITQIKVKDEKMDELDIEKLKKLKDDKDGKE